MGSRTLLGLAAALLIGACDGAGLDISATGGEIPLNVPGVTAGLVTFNDVVIDVNALNETSVAEISFRLNSVTKTVAGTAVDEGVRFTFATLDSGNYSLVTTWGGFAFALADDGTITTSNPKLVVSGNLLTIQNTAGFSELAIDAVNDTSVTEMAYRLLAENAASLPANRQIGSVQTIPGTDAQEGVTFEFLGMVPGQRFRIRTMLGTAFFVLDSGGNPQPFGPVDEQFMNTSGSTITIQNTISFDPLEIPARQNTTQAEVSYFLQTGENSFSFPTQNRRIGATQTIAGTAVKVGVTFPFIGMAKRQTFLLRTSFGDIFLSIDDNGAFKPAGDDTSGKRFSWETGVMTLDNMVNHILKVYFEFPDASVESTTIRVFGVQAPQLPADRSIGMAVVSGADLVTGVEIEVFGLLHRERVVAASDIPVVGPSLGIQYQPRLDGTAIFESGATEESPTKGSLAFTPAPASGLLTNTYFIELRPKPENQPPVVDAGKNLKIRRCKQPNTVLKGTATDPDGDELTCRWLRGATVVAGPTVMTDDTCDLDFSTLPPLSVGEHSFTLSVTDGEYEVSDEVIITVRNSSPVVCAKGAGFYKMTSLIRLNGQIFDPDDDVLTYFWRLNGSAVTHTSTRTGGADKGAINIRARDVSAADFGPGVHIFELVVDDGLNDEVVDEIVVQISANATRVHCPVIHPCILAPADGELHPVTLSVNAWDLTDKTLDTSVEFMLEDGSEIPDGDIEVVSFDRPSGAMQLRMRAVATETGPARTYLAKVTATEGGTDTMVILKVPVIRTFVDLTEKK